MSEHQGSRPRWAREGNDFSVSKEAREPEPKPTGYQSKWNGNYCECGCGHKAGFYTRSDKSAGALKGKPRRFLPGHQAKKASLEALRVDKETEREHREFVIAREIAMRLAEAREKGLEGDEVLRHLLGSHVLMDAITMAHLTKSLAGDTASTRLLLERAYGKASTAKKQDGGDISSFLDANHVVPEADDEWDD